MTFFLHRLNFTLPFLVPLLIFLRELEQRDGEGKLEVIP